MAAVFSIYDLGSVWNGDFLIWNSQHKIHLVFAAGARVQALRTGIHVRFALVKDLA